MATFEEIRNICNKANDAAAQKGDAQAKAWLRRQFAKHQDSIYNSGEFASREDIGFDFELDGTWYTLKYGKYRGRDVYDCHRNFKKSPTNTADDAEAAEGQAKLAALFGK